MELAELFPKENTHRDIYCDKCTTHLELSTMDFEETVSDVKIHVIGLPNLVCPNCSSCYLPHRSRIALIELHGRAREQRSTSVSVNRNKTNDNFNFTNVPFLYDSDDYHYIPGLQREHDEGFLTPVFFNKEVLLKYDAHPSYSVHFASRTYGTVKQSDYNIPFGINRNGKLVMWLGDIAQLPVNEQYYLRSENVDSDHSIGSEFYDGQIECKFTDKPPEDSLFEHRSLFLDAFKTRFNEKAAHLEKEVFDLALSIRRPVVDSDRERRYIADALNKVYLESLDKKVLGKALGTLGMAADGLGSIKLLEKIISHVTGSPQNGSMIMRPFFVLYDLRVAYSHLGSANGQTENLKRIMDRLGLNENINDLLLIYDTLISQLNVAFEEMTAALQK